MDEDVHAIEDVRNEDSSGSTVIVIQGNKGSGSLSEKPLPDNNRRTKLERRITPKTRGLGFRRLPVVEEE